MTIDAIEGKAFTNEIYDGAKHLETLHMDFDSKVRVVDGVYENFDSSVTGNAAKWLGEQNGRSIGLPTVYDAVKQMYSGAEDYWGETLGLERISNWKINEEFRYQNIKQQAGYAAEVISTTKDNLKAAAEKSGIKTYRADDRPDLFPKNDQYVDKIRVDQDGNIIERIQSKFVGKNSKECLAKLSSSKYDKYFNDGKVDKIEVPSDYYDGIKKEIPNKIARLQKQLDHVQETGNDEAAKKIQAKIDRYNKIDQMLEKSSVSSGEAKYAREHPKRYVAKIFTKEIVSASNKEGLKSAESAALLTAAVSTIDNVQKVMNREITPEDAFKDVAKDTAIASGVGYGTAFVSTAVSQSMSTSSHALIKAAGSAGIPATVISFGVESYESVIDYAQGAIDGSELAQDLGKNASNVAGGALGSALAGAAAGSVVPGAGTAVGFAAGMVGGLVGTAVASEAYATAIEYGPDAAQGFADKAEAMANQTVDTVKEYAPEKVETVKTALNDFFGTNKIPVKI